MTKKQQADISVLAGLLSFFLAGLIVQKREILEILMAAVITGVGTFFIIYFAIEYGWPGKLRAGNWKQGAGKSKFKESESEQQDKDKNKGTKIDITIDE